MNLILIGAGFSRNWGGLLATEVFSHLLGQPVVQNDPILRAYLMRHQQSSDFEGALAELQRDYAADPGGTARLLLAMQTAIETVFGRMNASFARMATFEFQQHLPFLVRTFLVKFGAIFSLNQDLLLEQHYLNDNIQLTNPRRWDGWSMPGMRPIPGQTAVFAQTPAQQQWTPDPGVPAQAPRMQPLYKLHGSTNWRSTERDIPLLVLGGDKTREINLHPILRNYFATFEAALCQPNSRLMIIGYGFRDPHINNVLVRAIEQFGLRILICDPAGMRVVMNANDLPEGAVGRALSPIEGAIPRSLIGISVRPLREIFGGDNVELEGIADALQLD